MRWSDNRQRPRSLWSRLRCARGGAAAAEFAVIVPAVLVLLTGAINLGAMATYSLALDSAVRAAANFAMTCSYNDPSINVNCAGNSGATPSPPGHATICSVITGAPSSNSNPCSYGNITVSFLNSQYATTATGYPQYCTWDNDTNTPIACDNSSNPCAGSQCPKHTYITIKAVEPLSPVLEWFGQSESVSRTLTFRVS